MSTVELLFKKEVLLYELPIASGLDYGKTKSWLFFSAFPQAPEIRLNDELLDNFVNDVVEDIALKTEDSQGVKTMSTTNFNIYSMPGLVICLELFLFC